jgi:hypothetical protein
MANERPGQPGNLNPVGAVGNLNPADRGNLNPVGAGG